MFWGCIQINFQSTFNYDPGLYTYSLDILFGLLIVIILLNVVVAIVGEAWDDAATQSLMFFWKYRVDKIQQYQGLRESKPDTLVTVLLIQVFCNLLTKWRIFHSKLKLLGQ